MPVPHLAKWRADARCDTPAAMTLTRRILLGTLGSVPFIRLARGETAHRVTILHINDFHSRHEAVDGPRAHVPHGGTDVFGGSARLATVIAQERGAAAAAGACGAAA